MKKMAVDHGNGGTACGHEMNSRHGSRRPVAFQAVIGRGSVLACRNGGEAHSLQYKQMAEMSSQTAC